MFRERTAFVSVARYRRNGSDGKRIQHAYEHDKDRNCANADPKLKPKNRIYVDRIKDNDALGYVQDLSERLREEGAVNRKYRKDAVGALEILMRANNVVLKNGEAPEDFDLDGWAERSMEWVDHYFNPPDHQIEFINRNGEKVCRKQQNIFFAVLHLDELNPHIHVLLTPVDNRGHFTAQPCGTFIRFNLQTSYARVVREFGLKRGIENSPAKYQDIRRYHTMMNETMAHEAPPICPNDTLESYKSRCDYEIRKCHVHLREKDLECEHRLNEERGAHITEIKKIYYYHRIVNEKLGLGSRTDFDLEKIEKIREEQVKYKKLVKAIKSYPDRSFANKLQAFLEKLIREDRERDDFDFER